MQEDPYASYSMGKAAMAMMSPVERIKMAMQKRSARQHLSWDPTSGQMTRQYMTPDLASNVRFGGEGSLADIGAGDIPAATRMPVQSGGAARPMPAQARPSSPMPAAPFNQQGVWSSTPAPGPTLPQMHPRAGGAVPAGGGGAGVAPAAAATPPLRQMPQHAAPAAATQAAGLLARPAGTPPPIPAAVRKPPVLPAMHPRMATTVARAVR